MNVERCKAAGVGLVAIRHKGGRPSEETKELERTSEFKEAQRFRNGVEGRISGLVRGRGMGRCPLKGREHFDLSVAASILASNLMCIANAILNEKKEESEAAA